ncbi:hypothetical protein, partial [Pseudomonas sp.]|uniref:hypothetical protein n=1 Tax=Pseudomonas sp. TaxID=306 RepID=UPI0028AFDEC1
MIGSIIQPPDLTNSHTVNAPLEKGRHSNTGAQGAHLPEVREMLLGLASVRHHSFDVTGAEDLMAGTYQPQPHRPRQNLLCQRTPATSPC